MQWRWKLELHSAFGFAVLFATSFIVFIGFLAWYSMLYKGWLASCIRVLRIKWLHEMLGYALIAFSQITIGFGVARFNEYEGNPNLGWISMGVMLGMWLFAEVISRY